MPNSATEKTKLAPRRFWRWGLLGVAVLAVVVVGVWQMRTQYTRARIGERTYSLARALTQAQKTKGLGDTPSLARGHGMLFVSSREDNECFWMKDMRYPLDIIWLDARKKVVHIERGVSPNSYPQMFCASGQYVIEINAGEVAQNGLNPGQSVAF